MQSLGGYTFAWNPDKMTIPNEKKDVSRIKTYGGSAIFEWEALLQGTLVVLEWNFMTVAQYNSLRALYLITGTEYVWAPETGSTYNVRITDFVGEYHEVVLHGGSYRQNVKISLDIRSLV